MEQFILYPHGSYLTSNELPLTNDLASIVDLSSRKQPRSRSDSEHSTEPLADPSSNSTRKRNNLSESETNNEPVAINNNNSAISPPATTSNNKSTLARTAILLAAKRAASNNTNNNDAFTLIDGAEDEADSNTNLFKQRFDAIDLTDEVNSLIIENNFEEIDRIL
jgi:hypothetical protein